MEDLKEGKVINAVPRSPGTHVTKWARTLWSLPPVCDVSKRGAAPLKASQRRAGLP